MRDWFSLDIVDMYRLLADWLPDSVIVRNPTMSRSSFVLLEFNASTRRLRAKDIFGCFEGLWLF